jgi:hypothetical protein
MMPSNTRDNLRMRQMPHGIPPARCVAVAKSTGRKCQRWATVGGQVCYHHGGHAGQVIDRAERRIIEMQLQELAPRKSRAEQLADARHIAYVWMVDYHNKAADDVLAGERPNPDDIAAALHGAKTVSRVAQLEAQMGVDDQLARNLQLEGDLVATAISAGMDWLAGALDQETGVRVRIGALQAAHAALVALEDPDTPLPDAEPPPFRLALVEQVSPRELEPVPSSTLADVSDDELEEEVIRRLRERGEVA